ncbi:MAG: OB-fold nucleic acid binding domain-containing protein, partial [Verrucomicrobiota bacterium]
MSGKSKQAGNPSEEVSEHQLIAVRREKGEKLQEMGVYPYGGKFAVTHRPHELKETFEEDLEVVVAGRMTTKRGFGKTSFFNLADIEGSIQGYIAKGDVEPEVFDVFKLLDMGDWFGIEGKTFVTKTGEPTVAVKKVTVLSKALRPLPDKFKGISDRELQYRKRYLDLISNERSREIFLKRS